MHSIFIQYEFLERQRPLLNEMNRSAEVDEDLITKYLSLIDAASFKAEE
jgi:hypothetical protein